MQNSISNKTTLLNIIGFLEGNPQKTKIVVKYIDLNFSLKAYDQKIHFYFEEFLENLQRASEFNNSLELIIRNINGEHNNIVYNLKQAFKYYKDFCVYFNGQVMLLTTYNLQQQQLIQNLQYNKEKVYTSFNQLLSKSKFNYFKQKLISKRAIPLFIIKIDSQYATVYKSNDVIFLKFNTLKIVTNKIKIHSIIKEKYEKITIDNFFQIFNYENDLLNYSQDLLQLMEYYNKKLNQKSNNEKLQCIIKIQKYVIKRLNLQKYQIQLLQDKKQFQLKRAFIWNNNPYLANFLLLQNLNREQTIKISAKQLNHTFEKKVYEKTQKLLQIYEVDLIKQIGNQLLKYVTIEQKVNKLYILCPQFDQIYAQNYSQKIEQTLKIRNNQSKIFIQQYSNNTFIQFIGQCNKINCEETTDYKQFQSLLIYLREYQQKKQKSAFQFQSKLLEYTHSLKYQQFLQQEMLTNFNQNIVTKDINDQCKNKKSQKKENQKSQLSTKQSFQESIKEIQFSLEDQVKSINIIKRFFKLNQAKFYFKTQRQIIRRININYKCIQKLDNKYFYICCFEKEENSIIFKVIQYQNMGNFYSIEYKYRDQEFFNLGSINKYQFIINGMKLIDNQIQIKLENYEVNDIYDKQEQELSFETNTKNKIRYRLINSKQRNNMLYNVVYSDKKLLNLSCDSTLININLKKMRNIYHSQNKQQIIDQLSQTSIDNIKYENNHIYINKSKLIPEKLQITQRQRFQLNIVKKQPKPMEQILYKSAQRFENEKYLITIFLIINQIQTILPQQLDNSFHDFETYYKIQAFNLKNKKLINWLLTNQEANNLGNNQQEILQSLQKNLLVLNDRFLFVKSGNFTTQQDILIIELKFIYTIQRICRNRQFYKNYQIYSKAKQSDKMLHILYNQYITIINKQEEKESLVFQFWDIQTFQRKMITLSLQKYYNFWQINQIICAKAMLTEITFTKERLFVKKFFILSFQEKFEKLL